MYVCTTYTCAHPEAQKLYFSTISFLSVGQKDRPAVNDGRTNKVIQWRKSKIYSFYPRSNVWMDSSPLPTAVGSRTFDPPHPSNANCFTSGRNRCPSFSLRRAIELLFSSFMNGALLEIWVSWSCCREFGIWRRFEIVFLWRLISGYVSGTCILRGSRSFSPFSMDNWMATYWLPHSVKNW